MIRKERDGYCCAYTVEGNGSYILTRDHFDALRTAWMRGEAFYTGSDHYGTPLTIKLARIEGIADFTPAACAEARADDEEERQERSIRGEP